MSKHYKCDLCKEDIIPGEGMADGSLWIPTKGVTAELKIEKADLCLTCLINILKEKRKEIEIEPSPE